MKKKLIDDLSSFFKMLGDPTRLKILETLLDSEISVTCIAEQLSMSQSAISHQLQLLRANNIVVAHRLGQIVKYRLANDHIANIIKDGLQSGWGVTDNGNIL